MATDARQQLTDFFSQYRTQKYVAGAAILAPDTSPRSVYYIKQGLVRQYGNSIDGLELTLNQFKPGAFFPVGPLINNTPNKYYYQATAPTDILMAPASDTLAFLHAHPDVVFDLLQRIYIGLEGHFLRIEALLSGNAYYKTITHLILHARRFGPTQKITHSQLASLAGLSRETVTREISKLKKQRLVFYHQGTLAIPDLSLLEQELLT